MGVATISARAAFTGSTTSVGPELIIFPIGDATGADAIGRLDVKEAGAVVEVEFRRDDSVVVAATGAGAGAEVMSDGTVLVAATGAGAGAGTGTGAEARRDGRFVAAAASGAAAGARRDDSVVVADAAAAGAEATTIGVTLGTADPDAGLAVKPLSEMDAMSLLI